MVKPLSLYFHIPFCNKKCPYCHFFVVPNKEEHRKALLDALLSEWQRLLPKMEEHEITSIYFGGGTPTLFGAKAIHTLLEKIPYSSDCEITIEANPEDVTKELMSKLKGAGINRVSIGVQSLEDDSLLLLERTHNAKRAIDAIHITHNADITNISIDLMYELPEQTSKNFENTLHKLKTLPITHLSLYNLTIEPNTAFFKRTLNLPSPEENLKMLQAATSHLEEIGLKRYEISAFARPGYTSRHNIGYWTARPFFGLGPSAFSYYNGKRFRNVAHLHRYMRALKENRTPVDFTEDLPYPQNVHELLAVQLRLLEGVDLKVFDLPDATHILLAKLETENFLERKGSHCKLTSKGILFYDTVATEII
ncbi:MAG: Oxygen-independent coproporphyrinogen-III oxidase-like protein YqeR [Chlamydiae bacterium]|nr:Oxygen-independent coproporphyrinogen-III oxidase-like protein YqeR [Chlamydiota bacterium]